MAVGAFLVVEDEARAAENLVRILGRWRRTEAALSVAAAVALLTDPLRIWTGVVADIGLPDGSGFDVVERARSNWPLLPVLMLTGSNDRSSINRAHALRAEYVCKPPEELDLLGFVRRAIAFERAPEQRVAWLVEELARRSALSPRETEIVAAALAGVPRRQLLDQLDVTDNTLKSQVRSLLHKTNHESLDTLARTLFREALNGSSAGTPVAVPDYEAPDDDAAGS